MLNKKLLGSVSSPPSDDNFENVSLLLSGDGTNGAQNNTFLDSSTNNFTITRNGNTTQGSFSPYGTLWSNLFGGSSSDKLSVPASSGWDFGSGNFTLEVWLFPTADMTDSHIFSLYDNSGTGFWDLRLTTTNKVRFYWNNASNEITSTGTVTKNQWNHIVCVRSGSTISIFINGTRDGTGSISSITNNNSADPLFLGSQYTFDRRVYGYLSNGRIVKGTAVYDATATTLTVPTTTLTAVSGTQLLIFQANRFKDSSSNNYTVTVYGSPSVQRFSPFNPTAPYSTSVIGGSAYFDGSGDYLTLAASSSWSLPANFTWECWAYPTSASADARILHQGSTGTQKMIFYMTSGAGFNFYYDGGSNFIASSIGLKLNAWNHIAGVRNGSTITIYINGVSGGTATSSATLGDSSLGFAIGSNGGATDPFPGYVSDARIVKGTAVYTAAFTPPTAPLTAITNTQLLTSMTNAGISDLAMQNNLETVGNAQVSTSVKKYGTGSLYCAANTDYFRHGPNNALMLGSGNFTIEFWVYMTNVDTSNFLFQISNTAGGFQASFTNTVVLYANPGAGASGWTLGAGGGASTGTGLPSINTWYHMAIVKNGSTTTLYVNGTSHTSISDSTNYTTQYIVLGNAYETVRPGVKGYIDDFRITKGVARYTTTFTPPTTNLPTY